MVECFGWWGDDDSGWMLIRVLMVVTWYGIWFNWLLVGSGEQSLFFVVFARLVQSACPFSMFVASLADALLVCFLRFTTNP